MIKVGTCGPQAANAKLNRGARRAYQVRSAKSDVRRKFYELAAAGPAPIASEALERIAQLYRIKSEVRGRGADECRAVRQSRSRPIITDLEPWLTAKLGLISQKIKLAEAIRYASRLRASPPGAVSHHNKGATIDREMGVTVQSELTSIATKD